MSQTISVNSKLSTLKKALSLILAAALVSGTFVFAPAPVKAEAAGSYLYGSSYKVKISLTVTDDADGWNSASCKIYATAKQGTGSQSLVKEYDIKDSISSSGSTWEVEYDCGSAFPSKVEIYTDFGGGFTWREWAADATVYINGVNVRSRHIVSSSSCFSSSDNTAVLSVDYTNYPYPSTVNILNHHSSLNDLPDEETFNEYYEGDITDGTYGDAVSGYVFINACDRYGVAWNGKGSAGCRANKTSNDSGDRCRVLRDVSASDVSRGTIYALSSNKDTDHKSTYTFTYNTGNESHAQVTKTIEVYFYFKHKLSVRVNGQTVHTVEKFRGEWEDLDEVPLPAGYSLTGYDQEGEGAYDSEANQFVFGTGDAVLTAALKANKYKIAFDGNGATSGAMNSTKTATYGTPLQLPANQFARRDELGTYKFLGWNTEPDGSGTAISNKGFALNLTPNAGEIVTLYAQWSLVGWTLTLHYPDEMGIEDRTIAVSKVQGYNHFEPEQFIDTGNGQYHYQYTGADRDLTDISEDMTVNLSYSQANHRFSEMNTVVPPTCEGCGEGEIHCLDCGYEMPPITILPTGHSYGEPEWNWSVTESEANAVFTCDRCGKVENIYCESTYADNDHMRTVSVSAELDGRTYTDTKIHHLNYISYNLNGGSGSLNTDVVYDGDFELPDLHPSSYKPYANFNGWLIGDRIYQPGDMVEAGDFTAVAQWDIPWANIQAAINGGASSIVLSCDIVATPEDGPLTVPAGRTVTINLNGYNIDRNLDEPTADGSVFKVTGGRLALNDSKSTGMVTGGNTTGNGGGIYVESGQVNLSGVSVAYNKAAGNGGGIYISGDSSQSKAGLISATVCKNICGGNGSGVYVTGSAGTFEMSNSAEVTGNLCTGENQSAGGVYAENATFRINQNAKVYENYKADESRSNVVLGGNGQQVTVWYPLESNALVYISGEPGRALVHDTNVDDNPSFTPDTANYRSDSYAYVPALNADKDIVFVNHTHAFAQPEWVWSEDLSSAQAVFGCTGCDYSESLQAAVTQTENNTHIVCTAVVMFGGEEYTGTAQKAKKWNIFVSGTQIDGDNYADVLGDGTVSYDVGTNTLTLTNAVIETNTRPGDNENEFGIRYSVNRGTPFKIALNGENTIVNGETGEETLREFGIACYNGSAGSYDSKPAFSGSGTLGIDLNSSGFAECYGIYITASVASFDACALNITISGSEKSEALHCNNSVVFRNGAAASLSTGTGSESASLYTKSLDVSADSSLLLVSGNSAVSANCVLTDGTKALGARVNTSPDYENGVAWNGTTSLSGYKYVSIPSAFTITWVVGGETAETDENVPGGATPEFNGTLPSDYDDGEFAYYFAGWSPAISPVAADTTYTADYTRKRIVDINITFNGKVYDGTPVTASDFTVTAVNSEYQGLVDASDISVEFDTEAVNPGEYTAVVTVSGDEIVTVTKQVAVTVEEPHEEMFISSFTADRAETVRGTAVTFTLVTSENINYIRFANTVDGAETGSTGFSKQTADSYTPNGDGTATWTVSATLSYADYTKLTETFTFRAYYYDGYAGAFAEGDVEPVSVNVLRYDPAAEIHEAAGEEVEPYSIIGVSADTGKKLTYTNITVTTTSDVTKLRLTSGGKSTVYSASSQKVTRTDNGDGTATWVIGYRFLTAGEHSVLVESRGNSWDGCSSATVTAKIYNNNAELAAALSAES